MRTMLFALALLATQAAAQTPLPEGDGRDITEALCTACHDTAVIRRSRLGRTQWDGLMDWMVDRHGMVPLDPATRVEVVDYLTRHFGPAPNNRGRSPFLN